MDDNDLPDLNPDEELEIPNLLKTGDTATETIDAQDLQPSSATTSGSFDLTEVKTTSLGKLLDALPTAALIIDRSLSITFANAACRGFMGTGEGLRGRPVTGCFLSEDYSKVESLMKQVFSDRKPRVFETMLKLSESSIWGRVHFRSIRFGKERGTLILVEDLTAEKKQLLLEKKHKRELQKAHDQLEKRVRERTAELLMANAQLKEEVAQRTRAEQWLVKEKGFSETALDSLPGIFYLCNAQGGILRWNKNLEKTLGYSAQEISRMNIRDFFPAARRRAVENGIKHVMTVGEHSGEEELRSKDGKTIPFLLNGLRITINQKQCFLGTGIDVSDRRRTEKALRESEERMRLVIEASPIGIAIVQDQRYVYVNPAFSKTFGCENAESIVGLRAEDLFIESDRSLVATHARDLLRGASASSPLEVTGVRQKGDSFEASMWLTAIDFQGKPSLLGFITDISKEKALRSQLVHAQKMEAIGTMAGGIAHDFNNLLTIIQGFSELLLLEKTEADRDFLDLLKIVQAARNGADLVRRILTFSRKVETKQRPIDLNYEVTQAENLLRRTIPKMIEIAPVLDRTLGKINADPGQIEQILLNLAVNAQHAMPDGGRLVIETKNVVLDEDYCRNHIDVRPGQYALLTIHDNGIGMTKDVLDHVFEPFFTTKMHGEGTGLGLAMVFGIVKAHRGAISCRSEPGVGTTFDLYFPVIEMPERDDVPSERPVSAMGNETILLVDDEESIRDLGKRILSYAGYHAITASNGMEALDIYRSKRDHIALVVLDLIMPVMSGAQCLEKLLQIDPKVRVLIASGFSVDEPTRQVVESGSKGFVGKPFKMSEVLTSVRRILDAEDNVR